MIYLVSKEQRLFESSIFKSMSVEDSINEIKSWKFIQFDTETSGKDAHLCKLLCAQFGTKEKDIQIVVDCQTIDIKKYKDVLENGLVIGQNLKFDLQFLYNYNIIPRKVYDTMIVEQLLYLGYPSGQISFSLKEIAWRRLDINIDKTTRGEIIWRGLDDKVIEYAAGDVMYLEDIMQLQLKDCKEKGCLVGAKLECDFVPVIAYLEWCGIKLDVNRWKSKMQKDLENLNNSKKALDNFVVNTPSLKDFTYINRQGDLFSGFNLEPQVTINWSSSSQVVKVAKILGFNVIVQDKKTGEDKESVLEKALSCQKGINDEFLKLYFNYQGYCKVVTSFGQGHLNAINPITGRIHTIYKQLGAASGRMSCGSQQSNIDLAKVNKVKPKDCTYPNMQQLPHDAETRACFIADKGNLWVSCDWSAAEARLAGDIYDDKAIKDIFLNDIDSHSMYAKIFFKKELENVDVHDIKDNYPYLRQKAKGPEFALNFGGGAFAIMQAIQCTEEEANEIVKNYEEGFKGSSEFAKRGTKFVQDNGYVLMCKLTGHKMYWWDWDVWKKRKESFTSAFWEEYKQHKGTGDYVEQQVKQHFKAASKWSRMARNAPTQGTCAVMLKSSQIDTFNWVVDNGYFGKVRLCALVHDK